MRVAVMGGRLQGVEAAYLAQKAGWQVDLVDSDINAPAVGLCHTFYHFDLLETEKLVELFAKVDFIIPAVENQTVLDSIYSCARQTGTKILYDPEAYQISSSKIRSDNLFARLDIPIPQPWPLCGFPITVKPSEASGSENVFKIKNIAELDLFGQKHSDEANWVKQEYLEGASYSIEIIGYGGQYWALQVTELEMDASYDCKRVWASTELDNAKVRELKDSALKIASQIRLNGIMDVEVILHDEKMKVLEIDARLPSQTPTVVYKSTGVNMLELLWSAYRGFLPNKAIEFVETRGVIYEHIKVCGTRLEVSGEHIMTYAGHLSIWKDFFGADEAITNYINGSEEWVATLIITAIDLRHAWEKREEVIKTIMGKCDISEYGDMGPRC